MSGSIRRRNSYLEYRSVLSLALAFAALAMLSGVVGLQVHAQVAWTGTVATSTDTSIATATSTSSKTLEVPRGGARSYCLNLTRQPIDENGNGVGGWWVRLRVDGAVRADGEHNGLQWTPSVGWEFNGVDEHSFNFWNKCRSINVTAADDAVVGTTVTFTHEVWDHTTDCPVHDATPVTVRIVEAGDGVIGNGEGDGEGEGEGEGEVTGNGNGNGNGTREPALPVLTISDTSVREGDPAEFVVTLRPASTELVIVDYETDDVTALENSDYTPREGTLNFQPGDTRKTISIPTTVDAMEEGTEVFTVRLSNPNPSSAATIEDGVGVGRIIGDVARRVDLGNRHVLPEIGRAVAFNSSRCRIDRMFPEFEPGDGMLPERTSLSFGPLAGGWDSARAGQPGRAEPRFVEGLPRDWSFLLSSEAEEGGAARRAAWGCGDYLALDGGDDGAAVAWEGEVVSAEIGADVRVGPTALAGLSISRSRATFDFFEGGRGSAATGRYELRLTGVHPYLGWSVSPDVDMWGTVGRGWGDLLIEDHFSGERLKTDATLYSGAVGVVGRLPRRGATTLKVKGELALARLHLATAAPVFGDTKVDMRRLRLGSEIGYEHALESGATLSSWGEMALRHDSGDGATGAGLELGSGLGYRNPDTGWTTESYSRWLALHDDGSLREWSFGAVARFDPEPSERGLTVSLSRAWRGNERGVGQPWDADAGESFRRAAPVEGLDTEIGYGFAVPGGRGVLTPYGAVRLDGGDGRVFRLGGRLVSGRWSTLGLELERRERPARDTVDALMLRAAVRF